VDRSLNFRVVGIAAAKGSMRAFLPKGSTRPILTSTNRSLKSWENLVRAKASAAAESLNWLLPERDIPVSVFVSIALPRPKSLPKKKLAHTKKPDLDKLARGILDALTGICYHDDSQVTSLSATKSYTTFQDQAPSVMVRVTVDEFSL
jgi:crossover junction endodeoxyribonuclease RusA